MRETSRDEFQTFRRLLPNPIDRIPLRAEIVGEGRGPLFRRRLIGSRRGLCLECFEDQVDGGISFRE